VVRLSLFLDEEDLWKGRWSRCLQEMVFGGFLFDSNNYILQSIGDLDDRLCNDKPYVFSYSENNLVGFFPNHWIRLHFVQIKTVALSSAQSTLKKVARAVLSWASPLANVSFPQ
jgi:hypothetical protein